MKKVYYVVTKELQDIDGIGETTGYKSIIVYSIDDNVPSVLANISDADLDDSSEEVIQNWLDDNGYGDESFELIKL